MKQLVILSGKGGTGKTSVTAAFAHLASLDGFADKTILADADVDAANLELVLSPQLETREVFRGGKVAEIDPDLCTRCGTCELVCRFDAIYEENLPPSDPAPYRYKPVVDPIACDGCAACVYQCPEEAIQMHEQDVGEWFRSASRFGPLFHAALRPAQENSGKLVTLVKQQARLLAMDEDYSLVLVDGPPGIGCPVISAVSGADLALIVTEPTAAGVHDMRRALQTVNHFGVRAMVCINKADIHPDGAAEIEAFCRDEGVEVVGRVPFDLTITEAMVQGEPVTVYSPDSEASQAIQEIWAKMGAALQEESA